MSITIDHLSKNYGTQKAVDDISFSVSPGEIVGFLGPNGAGKSTTMKMITGYLAPDNGNITVCGIPVQKDVREVKKKIGYLPEANPLYTDMYVKEYLSMIAGIHQLENINEKISKVITTVGLSLEAHKKIGQLSKGYRQRVGLAAALVHDPEVLILDEPASGLDPNQIVEIRAVIRSLSKNKTVLFSSHIMQEVEAICDRVIIIHKGRVVADKSLSELRRHDQPLQTVIVEFSEAPDQRLFELYNFEIISSENNIIQISTNDPELIRKQVLQLSVDKGLNIVSLQTKSQSLEAVFKSLTS